MYKPKKKEKNINLKLVGTLYIIHISGISPFFSSDLDYSACSA